MLGTVASHSVLLVGALTVSSCAAVAPTSVPSSSTKAAQSASAMHSARMAAGARSIPSRGGITLRPTGRGSLSGRVIAVDPGHNGRFIRKVNNRLVPAGKGRRKACNTSGASGRRGLVEHRLTWDVSMRLVAALRARGATVALTRPSDKGVGPCVNERAAIANRAHADLAISLHADGNTGRTANGFHIILANQMANRSAGAPSNAFALRLRRQIQKKTPLTRSTYIGRGTALSRRSDIAGVNLLRVPGVMLEMGNIRHPTDAALLANPAVRRRLAGALVVAVDQQL